jgi:alpha-ketoglutarate-dependent taurine dioxygenase
LAAAVLCDSRLPSTPTLADDVHMETVTMPEVHKSGGLIGAEIRGLDLTRQYPDETYRAILRAWAEHGVIFLRDQHLNAEQRDAFASRLGEIRVRQELRKEPARRCRRGAATPSGRRWGRRSRRSRPGSRQR